MSRPSGRSHACSQFATNAKERRTSSPDTIALEPAIVAIPNEQRWLAGSQGLPQGLDLLTADGHRITPIPCLSEAVAMDVGLTPTGTAGNAWSLNDRLGRTLGEITKFEHSDVFVIVPHPEGTLRTVKSTHAPLHEAMSAIAEMTNGACTLDSQGWVSRGSAPGSSESRR